jgi:phosphoribosylglycinamide formyltransferase-1
MVHVVDDEGVDCGPVLATAEVPMLPGDDLATFTDRVHAAEHRLLVQTVTAECRRLGTKGITAP